MLKSLKAVIFDNDGTVANTRKTVIAGMDHIFETVMHEDPKKFDYLKWIGLPLEDQMPKFTDNIKVQKAMVQAYRDYDEIHHDGAIEKFDGCKECLSKLKDSGLTLAVATSKLGTRCARGLKVIEIAEYMSEVIGCEDTEKHKPEPDPILFCAKKIGIDIENCAYVGDAPFDIQAAKAAGCVSIGVTWGFFEEKDLAVCEPDYIVHTFEELSDLLL